MSTRILIKENKILKKVQQLAKQLTKDYAGKNFVIIAVLNGSYILAADLSKELHKQKINFEIDFVGITSYGSKTTSSKQPKLTKDIALNIKNKHVLVVEDIVDTGWSLAFLLTYLKRKNPRSIKILTLLSKPSRREKSISIDYVGFEIDDKWVEGYGMDTKELGRGNSNIIERLEK